MFYPAKILQFFALTGCFLSAGIASPAFSQSLETILYNGALGNTPDSQGWLAYGITPFSGATQVANSGYTTLNALTSGTAGYSNYRPTQATLVNSAFPALNRTNGYSVSFQARLNSESHSSDRNGDGLIDRAGFSLTALSSDRQGIELGFWTDEIWAQRGGTSSTLFTHSPTERVLVPTTAMTNYNLLVLGSNYYLSANDVVILRGTVQNYTAFSIAGTGLPYNPYTTANFLFIGDNTSSGASNSDIASLVVNTAKLGTSGNDTLNGTASDDLLNGLAGSDSINAGAGNDTIIGGDGNDRIAGDSGNDREIGGNGNDSFVYDTNAAFTTSAVGLDTILDLAATDKIILDKTTFTALASVAGAGFSAASDFAVVSTESAVATSSARIVYNTSNGGLYYNQNGSEAGLGTGAQFATLFGKPTLSAANFSIQL
ncbi:calcium-binding protein [Oscillatoria sp. FACHB-1406]|uniref:calcium-binding protein n=1 Tax=Oscillatoria sp. FACHB-1406 TaxID=2692846 RepID=UPI0016846D11|nr:calcium-binding protein [Oscillatoria sp. FACHB-1406]MBD2580342.1 calcium-binding protein [Oscillatoria sp. FACHB-1406]